MKIDVFTTCYNEEIILPYFIKHYKKFARNIFVYDNNSNDASDYIMKASEIIVSKFDTGNKLDENVLINWRNNCWKNSNADWVIVCDTDEFIYHPNLLNYLENTNNSIIFGRGYEMMSEVLPTTVGQIYDEIKTGYPTDEFISYNIEPYWKSNYSKAVLFRPSEIQEINYGPGSHYCTPIGNINANVEELPVENIIRYPIVKDGFKLLHYKYLSRDYVLYKNKRLYNVTKDIVDREYDCWLPFCKNVID